MADPASTSVIAYFSVAKLWSITAGVCGSIIPILALADRTKITKVTGFFMALTGSSFSIFVGPWLSERMGFTSIEGIVALSWMMGAGGVYLIRAILNWLDKRAADTIDMAVSKALGLNRDKLDSKDSDTSINISNGNTNYSN